MAPLQAADAAFVEQKRGSGGQEFSSDRETRPADALSTPSSRSSRPASAPLVLQCLDEPGEAPVPLEDLNDFVSEESWTAPTLPTQDGSRSRASTPPQVIPEILRVAESQISGLDGLYQRRIRQSHCDLPVWEMVGGRRLIFYSCKKHRWYISDKIEDRGLAFANSYSKLPVGLSWSNGTTVQEATDITSKDLRRRGSMFIEPMRRLSGMFSPEALSDASSRRSSRGRLSLLSRDSGKESADSSEVSTNTSDSNLREKRGMLPLELDLDVSP